MEYLPIFINLKKKTILIIGGGNIAARKFFILEKTGAKINVVSKKLCSELLEMYNKKKIIWIKKNFHSYMLKNIYLVIAATNDSLLNKKIYEKAEKKNILVNVVDYKKYCSFIFPSIINRYPIIIAISSGGRSPVLIRIIKEKIEKIIPNFIGKISILAGYWRKIVEKKIKNLSDRKNFWERAFNGYLYNLVSKGLIKKANKEIKLELNNYKKRKHLGEVFIVGAGPGNSNLLTLKAFQTIQYADVVLYDGLISKEIIDLIRRDAKKICVEKRFGYKKISQKKINNMLIKLAKDGKNVVRLKCGDPFIFGRGGEELKAISSKGIPFQIIPGITAGIGIPAYAGIPLTYRKLSHIVTFISGCLCNDFNSINWKNLILNNQTLVIYMAMPNIYKIRKNLIFNGLSCNTPTAIISKGTYYDQKIWIGTLNKLKNLSNIEPPSLLIIGKVVSLHKENHWFGKYI